MMENTEEIVRFTEEEAKYLKEKIAPQLKNFITVKNMVIAQNKLSENPMSEQEKKDSQEGVFEFTLILQTFMDEPGLLLQTKSIMNISFILALCDLKNLVGFKKAAGLSAIRKLEKERDRILDVQDAANELLGETGII